MPEVFLVKLNLSWALYDFRQKLPHVFHLLLVSSSLVRAASSKKLAS